MTRSERKDRKDRRGARRFLAIGLATVLMFFSYTMFIFGFAAASEDETVFAGGLIGIATGLTPAVFFAAATLSHRRRAIRASALATVVFFAVAIPIAILDIPTGLVAGFGAGGMIAIPQPDRHATRYRVAAVLMCVLYTFALQRIAPAAGLMVGALVPLIAIAIADVVREREVEALAELDELASP